MAPLFCVRWTQGWGSDLTGLVLDSAVVISPKWKIYLETICFKKIHQVFRNSSVLQS